MISGAYYPKTDRSRVLQYTDLVDGILLCIKYREASREKKKKKPKDAVPETTLIITVSLKVP